MAMQSGIGFSKIIIFVGAGYTGTILLKNTKLSDLVAELQALAKGLEKASDSAHGDSDPIADQVRWLAQEIRQLSSARQITVLNGGSEQPGVSTLLASAAALGAFGYAYMRWKGLSISDLMYVTKRQMSITVEYFGKECNKLREAIDKAKGHLFQQILNLGAKVDEGLQMSKIVMNEVDGISDKLDEVADSICNWDSKLSNLEEKVKAVEHKQDLILGGVNYLCEYADGRSNITTVAAHPLEQPTIAARSLAQLPYEDARGLQSSALLSKGLKELTDDVESDKETKEYTAAGDFMLDYQPTGILTRFAILEKAFRRLNKGEF